MCAKPSSGETVLAGLKPYPRMRDSGVEWLGDVPAHWEVRKLKHWLVVNRSTLSGDTHPDFAFDYLDIGSVGTGNLVAPPQRMRFQGSPSRARRVVREGDTIISTVRTYLKAVWYARDVQSDLIASTGFAVLTPTPSTHPGFVGYVCQSSSFTDRVSANSVGVAYPAIAETKFSTFEVAVPPLPEQTAIARFLDHATDLIDRYIRSKEKLIALLEEQKRAIINEAVTGHIDVSTGQPYMAYKRSNLECLGAVPKHWDVRPAKWHFREVDERSETGSEELLSVSHVTGVTLRSEKNVTMFKAASNVGHKLCMPGDLVINTMWAWMAALGMARQGGIVSPSYAVYRPISGSSLCRDYAELMLRSAPYQSEYQRHSTGIRPSRLRLYPEVFLRIRLICPPPEEQSKIIDFVSRESAEADHAVRLMRKEIVTLNEYRTRLISDVVTGKLDVRRSAAT